MACVVVSRGALELGQPFTVVLGRVPGLGFYAPVLTGKAAGPGQGDWLPGSQFQGGGTAASRAPGSWERSFILEGTVFPALLPCPTFHFPSSPPWDCTC